MNYAYSFLAVLFALARVTGLMVSPALPPLLTQSLKDAAHLFDGYLFGAGIVAKRRDLLFVAIALAVIELVTFLVKLFL